MASNEFRKSLAAAVTMQACWRRYSAMLNFELDVLEVVIAQSIVRRMLAQLEARKRRDSVQVLQNFARRWYAVKTLEYLRCQHHDYVERQLSAICLQVSWPHFLLHIVSWIYRFLMLSFFA